MNPPFSLRRLVPFKAGSVGLLTSQWNSSLHARTLRLVAQYMDFTQKWKGKEI